MAEVAAMGHSVEMAGVGFTTEASGIEIINVMDRTCTVGKVEGEVPVTEDESITSVDTDV